MNRLSLAVATILFGSVFLEAQGARPGATPIPKVSGPIPVTADSVPFLAESKNLQPVDLPKHGYVEEEFIVSGTANVYDWAADGAVNVKTANAPYGTRILVRHPADPRRFSGSVIVELMYTARRFDWPMMWGYSRDYILEHGDAWVGVTMPAAAAALTKFNPTRYAAVSFPNPTPTQACGQGPNATSDSEEGLRWDMLSQVGALLKGNAPNRPMAGFKVERLYMTMQSGDVMTYINAIHSLANLETGKPVYDGYLVKSPTGPARINRCASAPARTDARAAIKKINAPVIVVAAQGEALDAAAFRRPDSDAPGERFRFYEIASGSHIDKFAYLGFPSYAEQTASGGNVQGTPEWPFNAKCDPDVPLYDFPLMRYAFNAAFFNLDQWVLKGTAPPHGQPLQIKDAGTAQASIVTDQFGNGVGGVRSPYVEVAAASYFTGSPGPGNCREMGHKANFDSARMNSLYGNSKNFASKVAESVDRLVKERWLTEGDGKRIKAEAASR
jgi:hypothetical protein